MSCREIQKSIEKYTIHSCVTLAVLITVVESYTNRSELYKAYRCAQGVEESVYSYNSRFITFAVFITLTEGNTNRGE